MTLQAEKATNEVLQKIGRNVLLFQEMEAVIKNLLAHGEVSGRIGDITESQEHQTASISKQTMGQLVGKLAGNVVSHSEEIAIAPEELKGICLSFSFTVKSDNAYYKKLKESLTVIVQERNELIHHLLPKFDLTTTRGTNSAIKYLDRQQEKILPTFLELKSRADTLQTIKKAAAEYFTSGDCKKYFDRWFLRKSRFVELMAMVAKQKARPDGWTILVTAGNYLQQNAPEEVKALKEKYGGKTLRELLVATELFEIFEEPTPKGGVRVLYRVKPA